MTNTEKALVILCMMMVMLLSVYDIVTLYNTVCWELTAECAVFAVSAITAYLTIAEKNLEKCLTKGK